MRRWANAVSGLIGTGLNRSAQSHNRAIYVRRRQSAYANRAEQGILAGQRALLVDRHANDRRRVFSYISNQASAETELAGFLRRGRRTSSPSQFGQTKFVCLAQLVQYVHS